MKYDTYLGSFFDKSLWSGGLAAFPDFFYIKKEKNKGKKAYLGICQFSVVKKEFPSTN